jgi:hypothetical protein
MFLSESCLCCVPLADVSLRLPAVLQLPTLLPYLLYVYLQPLGPRRPHARRRHVCAQPPLRLRLLVVPPLRPDQLDVCVQLKPVLWRQPVEIITIIKKYHNKHSHAINQCTHAHTSSQLHHSETTYHFRLAPPDQHRILVRGHGCRRVCVMFLNDKVGRGQYRRV